MNVIAVMEGTAAGAIVYWRLSGDTDGAKLREAWLNRGLDPMSLPRMPSDVLALSRAVRTLRKPRRLVRPLKDSGWAVVDETETTAGTLHYETFMRVFLHEVAGSNSQLFYDNPSGQHPPLPAEQAMMDDLDKAFANELVRLSQSDISNWLTKHVYANKAVTLRDTGGIYFVPKFTLADWQLVAAALREASQNQLFEIPAVKSDEAVDALLDALGREADATATKLEADLTGDLGQRALNNRVVECQDQMDKVTKYETLLGKNLDQLRGRLDNLKVALATAALAAEEEEAAA
jgi:hypothetical protein